MHVTLHVEWDGSFFLFLRSLCSFKEKSKLIDWKPDALVSVKRIKEFIEVFWIDASYVKPCQLIKEFRLCDRAILISIKHVVELLNSNSFLL